MEIHIDSASFDLRIAVVVLFNFFDKKNPQSGCEPIVIALTSVLFENMLFQTVLLVIS